MNSWRLSERPIIVWFSNWISLQLKFLSWHCCYLQRSTMRLFWKCWKKHVFLLVLSIPSLRVWYRWCWPPTKSPFQMTNVDALQLLDHPSRQHLRTSPSFWEERGCRHAHAYEAWSSGVVEVCRTLGMWLEYESILRKLPMVSEVAINHWVFLRCDWSPNSIWFYYRS